MADEVLDVKVRMDQLMVGVRFFMELESVDDLLRNVERAHTLGPILDPTAYRNGLKNLDWQTTVLRAVKKFQTELEPVKQLVEEARQHQDEWEALRR